MRQLFVDANGAFAVSQALSSSGSCPDADIRWFEEPVPSDDHGGLGLSCASGFLRGIDVAAGEYIYTLDDARALLSAKRSTYCRRMSHVAGASPD